MVTKADKQPMYLCTRGERFSGIKDGVIEKKKTMGSYENCCV